MNVILPSSVPQLGEELFQSAFSTKTEKLKMKRFGKKRQNKRE